MTVILIDARNATYRFGFAYRSLSVGGQPTGAVYGLVSCLLRLKKKYHDARFVMVWDGEGTTWRHVFYPGYKANRKKIKSPEVQAVLNQIPVVKDLTELLGIPNLQIDNVEADDVIAVLARSCVRLHKTVVYSSDMDFLQLMADGIAVIRDIDKKDKLRVETENGVLERFGCKPCDIVKLRALTGDVSDNIPQVHLRCGVVTAAKYLRNGYGPLVDRTLLKINYDLMVLPKTSADKRFTKESRYALSAHCQSRTFSEEFSPIRCRAGYAQFISVLARLELAVFIENRLALWHIQGV